MRGERVERPPERRVDRSDRRVSLTSRNELGRRHGDRREHEPSWLDDQWREYAEELERRAATVVTANKMLPCRHDEESWYCDSCKYEQEKRVAAALRELRALLPSGGAGEAVSQNGIQGEPETGGTTAPPETNGAALDAAFDLGIEVASETLHSEMFKVSRAIRASKGRRLKLND